jgi:predicted molibdopterin-dependent oxidoreductase YjgC
MALAVERDRRLAGAVDRGRRVRIVVDGAEVVAYEGESLAAALLAAGRRDLRVAPRRGEPRGVYCGIGLCFECVLAVDGRRVRACQTPVRDGMSVGTPRNIRDWPVLSRKRPR